MPRRSRGRRRRQSGRRPRSATPSPINVNVRRKTLGDPEWGFQPAVAPPLKKRQRHNPVAENPAAAALRTAANAAAAAECDDPRILQTVLLAAAATANALAHTMQLPAGAGASGASSGRCGRRPQHRCERADARDCERVAREHRMRSRCAAGAEGASATPPPSTSPLGTLSGVFSPLTPPKLTTLVWRLFLTRNDP